MIKYPEEIKMEAVEDQTVRFKRYDPMSENNEVNIVEVASFARLFAEIQENVKQVCKTWTISSFGRHNGT